MTCTYISMPHDGGCSLKSLAKLAENNVSFYRRLKKGKRREKKLCAVIVQYKRIKAVPPPPPPWCIAGRVLLPVKYVWTRACFHFLSLFIAQGIAHRPRSHSNPVSLVVGRWRHLASIFIAPHLLQFAQNKNAKQKKSNCGCIYIASSFMLIFRAIILHPSAGL